MPAILAHFQFGREVVKGLSGEVLETVKANMGEFILGLQGPDVLFFYKPYTGTYISKTGSLIHRKAGRYFFEKGRMSYAQHKDDSLVAYLIGCVCHYCLDKNAHPYVNEKASVSKEHHALEAEFDLYISKLHGLKYPRNAYLPEKVKNSKALGSVYNISAAKFANSLSDMRRYSKLLENRKLVEKAERVIMQKGTFSCMSPPETPVYQEESEIMHSILYGSIEECRSMIGEFYKYVKGDLPELHSFEANFEGK